MTGRQPAEGYHTGRPRFDRGSAWPVAVLAVCAAALAVSACAPFSGGSALASAGHAGSPATIVPVAPLLSTRAIRMSDGAWLPLRQWEAAGPPHAILIALHGFNDHAGAFEALALGLRRHGIATYALDQRGFGSAPARGRWVGTERLAADLRTLASLLRTRHPGIRLLVAGESMGGAVALAAASGATLPADGLLLIAPAVWSRATMPWYQRLALDTTVRLAPGWRLSGRGLEIRPSDNRAVLAAMGADPLVIKETRVEALWGVTNLMDQASQARPAAATPTLVLYGEQDQIIPARAFCRFFQHFGTAPPAPRLVLYQNGWHLLTRDLQAARVHEDIAAWILDPDAPLPSDEEVDARHPRLERLCQYRSRPEHRQPPRETARRQAGAGL